MTVLKNQTISNPTIDAGPCGSGQNAEPADLRFRMQLRFMNELERGRCRECNTLPRWLAEVRRMRAQVIYEQGRRPSFRMPDGSFDDPESDDLKAYHVVARLQGAAVGCARILPLANNQPCAVASTIGEEVFDSLLSLIGTMRDHCCEASRWVVVPECRYGLGSQIVAASWAVARWLSIEMAFVLAGTRQKQDCALIHMGARAVQDLPLFHSEIFGDDLRLLYFDVFDPSERMAEEIDEMTSILRLNELRA